MRLRWAIACVGLLVIFAPFFTAPTAGFYAREWDSGVHIALILRLLRGDIFFAPYEIATEHLVSTKLPIYHGLLLSHALVAFLVRLSVPLAQAMKIVATVALASVYVCGLLFASERNVKSALFSSIVFFTVVFPTLLSAAYWGSYAQIVSLGFYSWALYLGSRRRFAWALMCAIAGLFCYPDAFIWVGTAVCLNAVLTKAPPAKFWRAVLVPAVLFSMALVTEQFLRMSLKGSFTQLFGSSAFVVGALLAVAIWKRNLSWSRVENLALAVFLIVVVFYLWTVPNSPYYFRKVLVWAPVVSYFVVPQFYGLIAERSWFRGAAIGVFALLAWATLYLETEPNLMGTDATAFTITSLPNAFKTYFESQGVVTNAELQTAHDWSSAAASRSAAGCNYELALLDFGDISIGDRDFKVRSIFFNSALNNFSITEGAFRDPLYRTLAKDESLTARRFIEQLRSKSDKKNCFREFSSAANFKK